MTNYIQDILRLVTQQSTCRKMKVGALLMRDNRLLATGYNSVPEGATSCENTNLKALRISHTEWSLVNEIHAEVNCIADALASGINISGATMYVSHSPCINCAKMIVACGIKKVVVASHYDKSFDGENFLMKYVNLKVGGVQLHSL